MKAVTPGNRPGEILFKNVELECNSLEDVNKLLNQIAQNVATEIRARSLEEKIPDSSKNKQHITDRLIKVGIKRFTPTYIRGRLEYQRALSEVAAKSSHQASSDGTYKNQLIQDYPFHWEEFKGYQQEFLDKINNQLSGIETENDFHKKIAEYQENMQNQPSSLNDKPLNIAQKLSKFFLYKDWQYYYDENFPNEYKLVSGIEESYRYILVKFDKEKNLVTVSTKKSNFDDPEIVAIMLEISRNVQRYANTHKENVKVYGLNTKSENDKQKKITFTSLADALNQGIRSSKDQEKKGFHFDFVD